jgi:hypothetical protein
LATALDLETALDRAVAETGLDPIWRGNVKSLLEREGDWRRCCGSHCDPCVLHLGEAVDRVRQLMRGD